MNHQSLALRREIEQMEIWREEMIVAGYGSDSHIVTALESEIADMREQLEYWEKEEEDDEQI